MWHVEHLVSLHSASFSFFALQKRRKQDSQQHNESFRAASEPSGRDWGAVLFSAFTQRLPPAPGQAGANTCPSTVTHWDLSPQPGMVPRQSNASPKTQLASLLPLFSTSTSTFANSLSANDNIGVGEPDSRCRCLKKKKEWKEKKEKSANTQLKKTQYLYRLKGCFSFFFKETISVCKSVVTSCTKKTWKKHVKPSCDYVLKRGWAMFYTVHPPLRGISPLPVVIDDCLFHIQLSDRLQIILVSCNDCITLSIAFFFMLTLIRQ